MEVKKNMKFEKNYGVITLISHVLRRNPGVSDGPGRGSQRVQKTAESFSLPEGKPNHW